MKKIAVMGMFRSGTNFFRTVVEWNYDALVEYNTYGWKHGLFPIVSAQSSISYPNVPLVVVSKHPLAAIDSLFRYYTKNGKNIRAANPFDSFLRCPITIFDESFQPGCMLRFRNPVDYYSTLYFNLLSAIETVSSGVYLRYEDAIADPNATFPAVARRLGLVGKEGTRVESVQVPELRTKNMGEGRRPSWEDYSGVRKFDQSFYDNQEYLRNYSKSDLLWVQENIDHDLLGRMGYSIDQA